MERLLNITERFFKTARENPDNIIFHYLYAEWKTPTYKDFSKEVVSLASHLLKNGLKRGDRAAIISENRHEWCSAYLSILMAGGIAVPIDSQLGPDEVRNLLYDSASNIVFLSEKTYRNVKASIERLFTVPDNPVLLNFDSPEYESLKNTEPLGTFPRMDLEDIASIIYTSGTTGNPKGVMITHGNFCSDAEALIKAGLVSREDNILSVLPLHHTYAFMCTFLVPVFLGASITYPASLKAPDLMSAIKERGVSILIGVPQLLGIIRNGIMNKIGDLPWPLPFFFFMVLRVSGFLRENFDINIGRIIFRAAHKALGEKFRFFASGGARLDPLIMKELESFGFTVLEGYGLTETSPVITFNPFSKRKAGSVGIPLPSAEIRILDPSETGEGEIAVKGPMVMKGYYRNLLSTSAAIRDGWFNTGDIGRIDKDGYLFITGRSKEVIVLSSGKNIYPEDVEKIYMGSPLIKEICILGEGKVVSESLHAVIVPDLQYARLTQVSNIQEAIKWEITERAGKIPPHMRISGFSLLTEPLPRTPLGKLRRFMIKKVIDQGAVASKNAVKAEEDLFADETVKGIVRSLRQFVKEGREITNKANLELDLGFDSLSKIELIVTLEKKFSLKLPEDFMSDVQTVKDLVEKIRGNAADAPAADSPEKTGWKAILLREPSESDLGSVVLEKPENRMMPAFLAYSALRFLFKLLFRLEAKGSDNIPGDRNFIITPNHSSYLDGFVVLLSLPFSYFRNTYSLGLRDFFTGFLKGRFAKTAHVIPIDSTYYLGKALQMSSYILKTGRSLSVFPEGGRSFDGNLMEFKKGVGILAVEMEVPVVPAYIEGAYAALPRGATLPKLKKISVTFGKPLFAPDMDFSEMPDGIDRYQYFTDVLHERVERLKGLG